MLEIPQPPHHKDIEQQVLGAVLLNDKLMKELESNLKLGDFYFQKHMHIYQAMLYLHYQSQSIEYNAILDRLEYKKKLDKDMTEYVLELTDTVASTANFETWVKQIKDLAEKRKLYELAKDLLSKGVLGVSNENLIKKVTGTLEDLAMTSNDETKRISSGIDEWFDNLDKPDNPNDVFKWGFKKMDRLIKMRRSELYLIAARPSLGKSAYALNVVKNLCLQGKKTLFVTLEMGGGQVRDRLMSNLAKVPFQKIKNREGFDKEEKDRMFESKEKIKQFNWWVYDHGAMTIQKISNVSRKMMKENGLDVIVVDYLQLMSSDNRGGNRVQEVEEISRGLKVLAQELDIPIIALSQLNRDTARENKEPNLHDLRSSGSLEQDANAVIMLHNKDPNDQYEHKHITLYIRKNRDGQLGKVVTTFIGDNMQFIEKEFDTDIGEYVEVDQEELEEIKINDEDLPF